jgi:hypothetical protein
LRLIQANCFDKCSNLRSIDIEVNTDGEGIGKSLRAFRHVKQLIEKELWKGAVIMRFDVGCGDIAIPTEFKALIPCRLHLFTSSELLRVSDWIGIETIGSNDFRHCPALREVIVSRKTVLREIHGFRDCSSLKSIEIRSAVELIGRDAFTHSVSANFDRTRVVRRPIFVIMTDEAFLLRNRRRCQLLNRGRLGHTR